jgi:hypothetical protein
MSKYKIQLKIIMLFTVAIFSTFVGDLLHSFFGDWWCDGSGEPIFVKETKSTFEHYEYLGCRYINEGHISQWHWGYRHWLYFIMCITLFVIQVVDIINTKK